MMLLRVFSTLLGALLVSLGPVSGAYAQQYPNRPVRFVVPFPPGGLSDVVARVVAQMLPERLGQQVVVENRTGGNGTIGAGFVAAAAPDGYTLLVNSVGDVTRPHYQPMPYDILKDFVAIGMFGLGPPLVLMVNASSPYKSVQDLVADARANPGKLMFGSSGAGAHPSIAIDLLKSMTGIDVVDVPYKGVQPATVALMGGEVTATFPFLGGAKRLAQSGRLRALAVTSVNRSPAWPEIPTMIESGFTGFELDGFVGLLAPAKTPDGIIKKLNAEVNVIVRQKDFGDRLANDGMQTPGRNTPEDFARFLQDQLERYRDLVKRAEGKVKR